jgi:hypothetical protein
VLLDHRQEIAEQGALVVGQALGAVGEGRDRRALAAARADARVTLAIRRNSGAVWPRSGQLRRRSVGAVGLV